MRIDRVRSSWRGLFIVAACFAVLAAACEDEVLPPVPNNIEILSGNNQYSKSGTRLDERLVVVVTLPSGAPAVDYAVVFEVVEGGGAVSTALARANQDGRAYTWLTLGSVNGTNRVRAKIDANPTLSVVFSATGADYYCPEEDPSFVRKFPRGDADFIPDLLLFTRHSTLNQQAGKTIAGIVQIATGTYSGEPVFTPFAKISYSEDALITVVRDMAFSRHGDLFISWTDSLGDLGTSQLETDFNAYRFGFLESYQGTEIATYAQGILVGCDERGPFAVGCRDSLTRFAEAFYAGTDLDKASEDAVTCDPLTGDIYFIHIPSNNLLKLPMSGGTPGGPTEVVVNLSEYEAAGANGMEYYGRDDKIYILVDNDNVKAILEVDPVAGTKAVLVDFFTRSTPGRQSDIAIRQDLSPVFIYTIDTENDQLLLWDGSQQLLIEYNPHPVLAPEGSLSETGVAGERLGLVVIP